MSRVLPYRASFLSFVLAVLGVVATASTAAAQGPGARVGASVDPDQFYVGAHYESNPLVDRLYFRPNAELGFGDDLTTVGLNFEFVYKVRMNGPWSLYGGGGPAINIFSHDDDSDAEGGLNFLFGAETTQGLFFEVKLGAINSPDVKFGVGYTWR